MDDALKKKEKGTSCDVMAANFCYPTNMDELMAENSRRNDASADAKVTRKPREANPKAKCEEKKVPLLRNMLTRRKRQDVKSCRPVLQSIRKVFNERKTAQQRKLETIKKKLAPPKVKAKSLDKSKIQKKAKPIPKWAPKICAKKPTNPQSDNGLSSDEEDDEELMGDPIDMVTTGDKQIYNKKQDPRVVFAQEVLEQGALYVLKKFRRVKNYKGDDCTSVAFSENPDKNRYDDIKCLDSTRVLLRDRPKDYIHANWITSSDGRKFICTQGPLENTLGDFWHMVMQEDCRTILMLCSLIEDDKEKCAQYYPCTVGTSMLIENTSIKLTQQDSDEHLTTSKLKVKRNEREFQVRHLQCTSWPDQSAPLNAGAALEIHRELSTNLAKYPVIIHCSAGIGRTCSVVGVELMLDKISSKQFESSTAIVRAMRRARAGAVQRAIQFLFMHYAVLEIFCKDGVFSSDNHLMLSFREKYQSLVAKANKMRKKEAEKAVKS